MNLCVTVQCLFHSHHTLRNQGKRLCSPKALRPDTRDILIMFRVVLLIDRQYISGRRPLFPHFHLRQLHLKHDFKQQFTIDLDTDCPGNERISRKRTFVFDSIVLLLLNFSEDLVALSVKGLKLVQR